jgi:hypothetical protein
LDDQFLTLTPDLEAIALDPLPTPKVGQDAGQVHPPGTQQLAAGHPHKLDHPTLGQEPGQVKPQPQSDLDTHV